MTIFFPTAVGPSSPGPEDRPEKWVTFDPAHPGAFRWLDSRTLQFRPAEPWPSLTRYRWTAQGLNAVLSTLMEPPRSTIPADKTEGLDPVEEIAMVFPEPVDPAALARMVSVELRPLPGLLDNASRRLGADDFQIKTAERRSPSEEARYVLGLKSAIPWGTRAIVHFRLSLDDRAEQSAWSFSFSTAEPFRIVTAGARERRYPVTPEGTQYTREQAIDCGMDDSRFLLEFSSTPAVFGPLEGKNLVHFSPAVTNLSFMPAGKTVEISGDFSRDTLYQVTLTPVHLRDTNGRALEMQNKSVLYCYFPKKAAYLRWSASQGIVERYGPQMVPVEGRGQDRLDLRIYPVNPLDRSFWPFPERSIAVDESKRPPGPGEEPKPFDSPERDITPQEIAVQISNLGSPPVSTLVTLPLRREGKAAIFGLDLAKHLQTISGQNQTGTYLVGLRNLSGDGNRHWMRIQVTDLSLTTLEEPAGVRFTVSAISTGAPVPAAAVNIEGMQKQDGRWQWTVLASGSTDPQGGFFWSAPGRKPDRVCLVKRIVVRKGSDVLVLDTAKPPEKYADNQWSKDRTTWLQWAFQELEGRVPEPQVLAHIFTERPVYRPEEEVHIKGYLRRQEKGHLGRFRGEGWIVVEGPGDLVWRYPVTLSEQGSFYAKFLEKDRPTGSYRACFEDQDRKNRYGSVSFQLEAYRLPRFEVTLLCPDQTALDKEFPVSLTATYYAGGRVSAQPVQWRVTQFPYAWTPAKREGFQYSSDSRYSSTGAFQSTPRIEREDKTNESGGAEIVLNPAIEPTAQPRTYVIEATVTGPDDQTVTATRSVLALPPFVLGVKAPRFIEKATAITPEIIAVGMDGQLLADKEITVRLLRREWHSYLRASDFSDGVGRYMTDVVDNKISETIIRSTREPSKLTLPVDKAGVYIVELESHDRLDRAQVVRVDLYAGGPEAMTWAKPVSRVFSVALDKARYDPGETASIILKSPFQQAHALAVVEAPEGNQYRWVEVNGGSAVFQLPIQGHYVPRVPVHFILMRGRLPDTAPQPGTGIDLGKPSTMAATAWLDVTPRARQVQVELQHPKSASPGQRIEVTVLIKDPDGHPLPGEVTLWLVDQAVLALGKERRLDPVPDFVASVRSRLSAHDSRNLAFGILPFAENPGGDGGEEDTGLLDRATVRKNFKSVPYYNPAILVGPDGKVVVPVTLSDDLTNFKLRAKAASGDERFGFGTGHLEVRLPVIVQPALPRFVRPGDSFTAAAIGRLVEGPGGPGAAEIRAEGVELQGPSRIPLTWTEGKPEKLAFPVTVPTPGYTAQGIPASREVIFKVGVQRTSDGASDAFEVRLPIREDRDQVSAKVIQQLQPGTPLALPAVPEPSRRGTMQRSVLVAGHPALVKMAAGLDFLLQYPYGCTEQQLSRARTYLALKRFRQVLRQSASDKQVDDAVKELLQWLPSSVDANGLVAYWPGSRGYVSLTAWTVQFLLDARQAGYAIDDKLLARLIRSLDQALRSDYSNFIEGEDFAERTWALVALAQAGQFNASYAAELSRKAQYLNLEGVALVLQSLVLAKQTSGVRDQLARTLLDGIVFRLYGGKEIYGGLQDRAGARNGLILPSETRTLGEVTRALELAQPRQPRLPLLVDALITTGRDDGWGTTNANASALLALSQVLEPGSLQIAPSRVIVTLDGKEQALAIGPASPAVHAAGLSGQGVQVRLETPGAVAVASVTTSYVPAAPGSEAASQSNGFVVTRVINRVRGDGQPLVQVPLSQPGTAQTFKVGDVVEEHIQVVNPKDRHYVAVVVPLAAGMEALNPGLATAPPEAKTRGRLTADPTYASFMDDHVAYYYNTLPAGTYDFYFRTRAYTEGSFIQPPAKAEMMYDGTVRGSSNGARIVVEGKGTTDN